MKVILVDQRHGHTRTIVLKGWLKGLLSICILGAPVAFGYLGYQFTVAQEPQEYTLERAAARTEQVETADGLVTGADPSSGQQPDSRPLRLAILQVLRPRTESLREFHSALVSGTGQQSITSVQTDVDPSHSASFFEEYPGGFQQIPIYLSASEPAVIAAVVPALFSHGRSIDPATYLHSTLS